MLTRLPLPLSATATFVPGRGRGIPCGLDRHGGPYEILPDLADFLGASWCRCGACGATITVRTAQLNAA